MSDARSEHPIQLLRLITRLNIGGPARQALSLSKELRPGYTTTLGAGTPTPDEGELADPEVPVTRLSLVRPVAPRSDLNAYRQIRSLVSAVRPAIIHSHMAKAGTLGRIATVGMKTRPILVHTFHGHVLEGYFKSALREAFLRTERRLAKRTDALVAVSDEIRDELLDLGIGTAAQWSVIPLGFDLSAFLQAEPKSGSLKKELGLADQVSLLGIVGRLVPIKDHRTAFLAMRELPANAHLVVVGDGEERAALVKLVQSMGLSNRVHFLGWRMDVQAVTSSLDIAVLSSRNEGSPVALIEALASGVPVVATDVGGVRSVVQDGLSGLLVSAGAPQEIASAVLTLIANRELQRKMGAAGRAHVRERFDQRRLVMDIKALYEDLLVGRSQPL